MRTTLDTCPKVIQLAAILGVPDLHAVGMLWKVWSWADTHSLDGNAICVTEVTLDRFTQYRGFAAALRKVGWLEGRDGALSFPRFAEHNGQTAKKRAETANRVAKSRSAKAVTDVTQKALPEKRREEKNKGVNPLEPPAPQEAQPPPFDATALLADLEPGIRDCAGQWLAYKRERREGYKPLGAKAFVSRCKKLSKKHGSVAVIDAMTAAMGSNWQGWEHTVAERSRAGGGTKRRNVVDEVDSFFGFEGGLDGDDEGRGDGAQSAVPCLESAH
jgi:hypothetical protein